MLERRGVDRAGGTGRRRYLRALLLPMALVLVAAVTGCGGEEEDDVGSSGDAAGQPAVDTASLDGRTFVSQTVTGHELVPDTELRLSFEGTTMAAVAGCNTQTGGYAIAADGTLAWTGPAASTMMGCEEALAAQDAWIAEVLTAGLGAALDGAELTLSNDDVTIVLAEEADVELVGVTWTLDALVTADASSSLPAGVEAPTLEFGDDGTVAVFTGCNRGNGSYEVGDGTIAFEAPGMTMMACGDEAASVETTVLAVLDGEVEADVVGETLRLTKGDTGLTYRAG